MIPQDSWREPCLGLQARSEETSGLVSTAGRRHEEAAGNSAVGKLCASGSLQTEACLVQHVPAAPGQGLAAGANTAMAAAAIP